MREVLRRLRFFFDRRRFDSDLDEEVRDHLRRKTEASGSESDSRRQFGNVTLIMEDSRNMWTWNYGEQVAQDIRYAIRAMGMNKLFTLMAVLSLALGMGANTAIYSFMDAVMIRALPVAHPEQLVILNWRAKRDSPVVHGLSGSMYPEPGGGRISPNFPYPAYQVLGTNHEVFESLFGHANAGRVNIVIDGQAEIADGQYATGGYFAGLGVPAAVGRLIGPDDDRAGAPPVVVITFDYWRSRFASNPGVIGKMLQINGKAFTIAGVTGPDFYGVSPGSKPNLFIPMADIGIVDTQQSWGETFGDGTAYWIELMGRLQPGVTLKEAQAKLAGPFHNFVAGTATKDNERADLPSLWVQEGASGVDALRRSYSKPLWMLMAMAGLILLIACANIANLLLSRASSRRREMAVRLSLGAGRFRIIRQLLTESILLAVVGAVLGVGVAVVLIRLLAVLLGNGEALTIPVGIDWRVLGVTLGAALGTGILFGLAPALAATRVETTGALKEARSSEVRGRTRVLGVQFGLGPILVVAQIALSLVLVVAAALFVRTLGNLHAVNLGFNAENILLFHLDASQAGFDDPALKRFYGDVQTRLEAVPGVRGATSSNLPLVGGWNTSTSVTFPGVPKLPEGERGLQTSFVQVGATFFETMELPMLAGRTIGRKDVEGSQPAVVINQAFADQFFHGQNPIGRHFALGWKLSGYDVEVVGVAKTARYNSLRQDIPPVVYAAWKQVPKGQIGEMFFEVRTVGDPLGVEKTVRQVVREMSPLVPVEGMITQKGRIDQTISQERTFAELCSWFGGLALLMASIGLYGTMAYAVARRTGEIGIRMALGAERGRIVWMVLREVIVLAGVGVAIGFGVVYEAVAFVQSMLFGLKPSDPWALGVAVAVLLGCALVAGFLPASRASSIDPIVALRHE